jgi:hypothetical protein
MIPPEDDTQRSATLPALKPRAAIARIVLQSSEPPGDTNFGDAE